MAEFVQIGRVDFIPEYFLVAFGKGPEVFEEQNNLRWNRRDTVFLVAKCRAGEEAERIGLDTVGLQRRVWDPFTGDRQSLRPFAQRPRQRRQRGRDLGPGELV